MARNHREVLNIANIAQRWVERIGYVAVAMPILGSVRYEDRRGETGGARLRCSWSFV